MKRIGSKLTLAYHKAEIIELPNGFDVHFFSNDEANNWHEFKVTKYRNSSGGVWNTHDVESITMQELLNKEKRYLDRIGWNAPTHKHRV